MESFIHILFWGSLFMNLFFQVGFRYANRYFEGIDNRDEENTFVIVDPITAIKRAFPRKHKLRPDVNNLNPKWSKDRQEKVLKINKISIQLWWVSLVLFIVTLILTLVL